MNLALATWTFAINFWAWNLIGPLSATYTKDMALTSTQAALLVATPILVGSVGRIPVGALTDRFGGRVMFAIVSVVTIAPVLLVASSPLGKSLVCVHVVRGTVGSSRTRGSPPPKWGGL